MLECAETFVDHRMADCAKVVGTNAAILGTVRLADASEMIQLLGGVVTIAYAVWRWRRDKRKGGQ